MKKHLLYIVIFLVGALAGMWAHRQYHFRDATGMLQRDTIWVFDTVKYSRLELKANTCKLDLQRLYKREYIYIDIERLDTVYRDRVQYVALLRENFHTRMKNVEIWHSGIDSTIDSLAMFNSNAFITESFVKRPKKHSLGFGIEANYATSLNIPVQFEYSYMVRPWLSAYAFVEYELLRKQFGIGAGAKVQIEW